jgi:hypothetical protein
MIRIAAFALFGIFVVYALGAFVAWEWDASNWPTEGRAVAAFTGFLAGVHLAMVGATFR